MIVLAIMTATWLENCREAAFQGVLWKERNEALWCSARRAHVLKSLLRRLVVQEARGVFLGGVLCLSATVCPAEERLHCLQPIAHRAGSAEVGLPEYSPSALIKAAADGLPVIEIDLQMSRDGVPFLFHGRHIKDRDYILPEGMTRVRPDNLAAKELRKICHRRASSQCLVQFSDALRIFESSAATIVIDPKQGEVPGLVDAALRLAAQAGMLDHVIVLCSPMEECRGVARDVKLMLRASGAKDLQRAVAAQPYAVQIDEELLQNPHAAAARRAGIRIMVKVLDELEDSPQHWRALGAIGVDAILTDYPRKLLSQGCE